MPRKEGEGGEDLDGSIQASAGRNGPESSARVACNVVGKDNGAVVSAVPGQVVEAAGIEPASASPLPSVLHA